MHVIFFNSPILFISYHLDLTCDKFVGDQAFAMRHMLFVPQIRKSTMPPCFYRCSVNGGTGTGVNLEKSS